MARTVFAPGSLIKSADVNANFDGAYDGTLDTPNNSLSTFRNEATAPFIQTGFIIPVPSPVSLTATIGAGVAYVGGMRIANAATPHTFTASKDTYVDLKSDGTFAYREYANGTNSGLVVTSGALCIAKVITSSTQVSQVLQIGADAQNNQLGNKGLITNSQLGILGKFDAATNLYYIDFGNFKMVWGTPAVASTGTTVTFPITFNTMPSVVATVQDPNNQTAWVSAISYGYCVLKQIYTGAPLGVSFIAIGR